MEENFCAIPYCMHASVHGILDSFTRDKHNEATCKTCMKTARYMYTVNGHTHTRWTIPSSHTLWLLYMYIPYNFNEKFVYNELTKHTCRMCHSILSQVHVPRHNIIMLIWLLVPKGNKGQALAFTCTHTCNLIPCSSKSSCGVVCLNIFPKLKLLYCS